MLSVEPKPEPGVIAPVQRPMIQVEGLYKAFDGVPVLCGVDLVVREGVAYVLLGRSGSGKTVLFRHLDGLLQPDRGRVLIDGHDLATLTPHEREALHAEMGFQFQGGALFDSMTVEDNVAFPLREVGHLKEAQVRGRVNETLALLGLTEAAQQLPAELSGGMRKRVAFARAIALKPRLLLSDEPVAGLDPLTMKAVEESLVAARKTLGVTAFIITFSLATAFRVADRIGFLHEGRIVEEGPPDEFKRSTHPEVHRFLREWLAREAEARSR